MKRAPARKNGRGCSRSLRLRPWAGREVEAVRPQASTAAVVRGSSRVGRRRGWREGCQWQLVRARPKPAPRWCGSRRLTRCRRRYGSRSQRGTARIKPSASALCGGESTAIRDRVHADHVTQARYLRTGQRGGCWRGGLRHLHGCRRAALIIQRHHRAAIHAPRPAWDVSANIGCGINLGRGTARWFRARDARADARDVIARFIRQATIAPQIIF